MNVQRYKVRHGYLSHFANDNTIGASLREYGEWAESEIFLLSKIIERGGVVIDVGANVGAHSLAFSRMVSSKGLVVSIEAQPIMFQLLAANLVENRLENTIPLNCLVGSENSMRYLPRGNMNADENFGAASFVKFKDEESGQRSTSIHANILPVPMIALDSLGLEKCDLLKVDVEGMELDVFVGAQEVLKRLRPVIYFEQVGTTNLGTIFDLLAGFEYELGWHVANPFTSNNFNRTPMNMFGGAIETNILAVPRERTDLQKLLKSETLRCDPGQPAPTARSNSGEGWTLPDNAYLSLDESVAHVAVVDDSLETRLQNLTVSFEALRKDRTKAQEIMEHQHAKIVDLERLLDK